MTGAADDMSAAADDAGTTFRRLVDGGLLYDAAGDCIHHLNETAAVICEHLRQGLQEDAIVQLLLERYEVDAEVLRLQVRETMTVLKAADDQ